VTVFNLCCEGKRLGQLDFQFTIYEYAKIGRIVNVRLEIPGE